MIYNYYVSSQANGGSGTEADPWDLTTAITKINDGTVQNGGTVWLKNDGIYEISEQINITVDGSADNYKRIRGYDSVIGDNGKPTIKVVSPIEHVFYTTNAYWILENLIIDSNYNTVDSDIYWTYKGRINCVRNVEVKNGCYGVYANYVINCISHDNVYRGFYGGHVINCIAYNNGDYGISVELAINCISKNNANYNYSLGYRSVLINSISDGSKWGFRLTYASVIMNCIIVNASEYGMYSYSNFTDNLFGNHIYNINFYNNANNINSDHMSYSNINTYYELDPQFKDPDNWDYTRTGNNLSDKGFSKVGTTDMPDIDYNIDIGIDQMKLPDYPSENDVRKNVTYFYGNKIGNLELPSESDVAEGVQYGSNGTEKTGSLDLPNENDVRLGVNYYGSTRTGKLDLPSTHDVEKDVVFDQGTKVGEFEPPSEWYVKSGISYGYNGEFVGKYTAEGVPSSELVLPLNFKTEVDGEISITVSKEEPIITVEVDK